MQNIVLVILLILALCLIVVVLIQRSEGGGLGIGGGGGNMSGRPPASPMAKFTWILGGGFMVASLAMTVIANRNADTVSVLERTGTERSAPASSDSPLGSDLLPPTAAEAPAAPPSAEE